MQPRIGLSDDDFELVTRTTHVVLHNAATILFNEPMIEAVENNCMVRGYSF